MLLLTACCLGQEPKEYRAVIPESARTQNGVFKVHQVGAKIYYEIPRSELGKPFLWLTRVARASELLGFGNESVARMIVVWDVREDRILLCSVQSNPVAGPDLSIARAVAALSNPTIILSFPVQAYGPDRNPVIEVTSLFATDVPEFSLRTQLKAQGFDANRSFIERVSAYPTNVEVEATYTYTSISGARPVEEGAHTGNPSSASFVLHHSMFKLPEKPMRPRLADPRVAFITDDFLDFGMDTNRAPVRKYIERWRLEKKDPAAAVSDVVKPIEIYVDPATPTKWVPYVKQGIEDWRPAFEQAGFRNAIVAREVAADDKDWSPEDARYTVVSWQPLTSPLAYTSFVTDPRSGEMLKPEIEFYHGIIDRMAGNYFVQVGPLDPRARKWPLPDAVIGEFVRYVVAHEVGHALGLSHNFEASAMYPAEKVRDKAWVREMGYSPSIEDYSRFNYVAQPEDGMAPEDLVPRVGPYDRWAIHWGYAWVPGTKTPEEEKPTLDAWAREQEKTPWFRWVTENGGEADPADRMESVGDADPIGSTRLGLKNLHRVMDMLVPATEDQNWRDLEFLYKRTLGQWTNEMLTVAGWVGGMLGQEKIKVGDGPRFTIVPREQQRAATLFLNEHAFATPRFLIRPDVLRRIEPSGEADHILEAQSWVLRTLLNASRLNRMVELEAIDGASAYSVPAFLADVRKGVWSEIYSGAPVDMWRRNLQRSYLEIMTARIFSHDSGSNPCRSLVRADLAELQDDIVQALARPSLDHNTRAHLAEMKHQISDILDPKAAVMPPSEPQQPSYFPLR